jgi:uncharacterized SAM-binding protein YcdF (DUF218 family)
MVGLRNTGQNARYVRGIFDKEEKNHQVIIVSLIQE